MLVAKIGEDKLSQFQALLDTGAQITSISNRAANQLQLSPHGKRPIAGAHGSKPANTYVVQLFIPIEKKIPVGVKDGKVSYQTQMSLFGADKSLVSEFSVHEKANFDILIGMDMLSECTLFVGDGFFYLSY